MRNDDISAVLKRKYAIPTFQVEKNGVESFLVDIDLLWLWIRKTIDEE